MPFGEYELSPSLIGLSLLHAAHPEAFQRLLVRASIPRYRDFTLAVCRSLGFASATADSTPSSGSPSLRLRASWRLASPATATRRLIMQKARRHRHIGGSDRLQAHGFRNYFTPLVGVLFTFPSRYSYTIGLAGVFSLAGWSRRIRTGFLVPRATQEAAGRDARFGYGALTPSGRPFQAVPLARASPWRGPYYPGRAPRDGARFGLFPVRSPLLGESLLFSLPGGTKMFQFPPFASTA